MEVKVKYLVLSIIGDGGCNPSQVYKLEWYILIFDN